MEKKSSYYTETMGVFLPFSVQTDLKMQKVIFCFVNHIFPVVLVCCWREGRGDQNPQVLLLLLILSQLHDFLGSLSQSIPQFTNLQSWYKNSEVSTGMQRRKVTVCKRLQRWRKKTLDNLFFQTKNEIDYSHIYT